MSDTLYALAYMSRSLLDPREDLAQLELFNILLVARRRNNLSGITGALMLNQGCFVQVLEGPHDAVAETYERIERDPRHRSLTLLHFTPIEYRLLAALARQGGMVVTHHTLDGDAPNWMQCSMTFEDAPDNTANTYLTMSLHIRLRRASGADLHPLGLLMGEAFMSRQMQNKMEEIANVFVQKSVNALAEQQNGASQ